MGNDSGAAGAADVTGGTVLSLTSASLAVSLDVSLEVSLAHPLSPRAPSRCWHWFCWSRARRRSRARFARSSFLTRKGRNGSGSPRWQCSPKSAVRWCWVLCRHANSPGAR